MAEDPSNGDPSAIRDKDWRRPRAHAWTALGVLLLILVVWIAMQAIRIVHWLGGGRRGTRPPIEGRSSGRRTE